MILVDTSVWIDHLHEGDAAMRDLLAIGEVLLHPYVLAELALGSLRDRHRILGELRELPVAPVVSNAEVLALIEERELFASGLGLTDVHLVASALVDAELLIWTRDKRFERIADRLGVSATLP